MSGEINWGPEIAVEGKRPEWLGDGVFVRWYSDAMGDDWWCNPNGGMGTEPTARGLAWDHEITSIRLPADHPHYATQQPHPAPSGGEVGPEVVERAIGLAKWMDHVRSLHADYYTRWGFEAWERARLIVALLPEPVDGDLIAAREACAAFAETIPDAGLAAEYRNGDMDDQFEVKASLFAVRGRSLEKGEAA